MDVSKCDFPFLSGPTWPEYAVDDWVTSPVSEILKTLSFQGMVFSCH